MTVEMGPLVRTHSTSSVPSSPSRPSSSAKPTNRIDWDHLLTEASVAFKQQAAAPSATTSWPSSPSLPPPRRRAHPETAQPPPSGPASLKAATITAVQPKLQPAQQAAKGQGTAPTQVQGSQEPPAGPRRPSRSHSEASFLSRPAAPAAPRRPLLELLQQAEEILAEQPEDLRQPPDDFEAARGPSQRAPPQRVSSRTLLIEAAEAAADALLGRMASIGRAVAGQGTGSAETLVTGTSCSSTAKASAVEIRAVPGAGFKPPVQESSVASTPAPASHRSRPEALESFEERPRELREVREVPPAQAPRLQELRTPSQGASQSPVTAAVAALQNLFDSLPHSSAASQAGCFGDRLVSADCAEERLRAPELQGAASMVTTQWPSDSNGSLGTVPLSRNKMPSGFSRPSSECPGDETFSDIAAASPVVASGLQSRDWLVPLPPGVQAPLTFFTPLSEPLLDRERGKVFEEVQAQEAARQRAWEQVLKRETERAEEIRFQNRQAQEEEPEVEEQCRMARNATLGHILEAMQVAVARADAALYSGPGDEEAEAAAPTQWKPPIPAPLFDMKSHVPPPAAHFVISESRSEAGSASGRKTWPFTAAGQIEAHLRRSAGAATLTEFFAAKQVVSQASSPGPFEFAAAEAPQVETLSLGKDSDSEEEPPLPPPPRAEPRRLVEAAGGLRSRQEPKPATSAPAAASASSGPRPPRTPPAAARVEVPLTPRQPEDRRRGLTVRQEEAPSRASSRPSSASGGRRMSSLRRASRVFEDLANCALCQRAKVSGPDSLWCATCSGRMGLLDDDSIADEVASAPRRPGRRLSNFQSPKPSAATSLGDSGDERGASNAWASCVLCGSRFLASGNAKSSVLCGRCAGNGRARPVLAS